MLMNEQTAAPPDGPYRAGYVAIIGEPNVGKSTLMNTLLGQKVSIVTGKPQTTRHKIIGILSERGYQIVFLDTPGLLDPKYLLHESMMRAAVAAVNDADIVLFMVDAAAKGGQDAGRDRVESLILPLRKPVFLVVNKVDVAKKHEVAERIAAYAGRYQFEEVFPVSALLKDGTKELVDHIVVRLPEHPPFYPPSDVSEQSERFFVAEIIRETIFESYSEEIPYSTTVDIVDFREQEGRKDVIEAEIYVERESQKGILIGKRGAALKVVGEKARKAIEAFLERPVFLSLHVKVRAKWRDQEAWLKRLGYR